MTSYIKSIKYYLFFQNYPKPIRDRILLFLCTLPIVFVLLFIGYLPVTFQIKLVVSIDHKEGEIQISKRSNQSLDIYYGAIWKLGDDTDHIPLLADDLGFDMDKIIFTTRNGVEKITFHEFSTSVWGITTNYLTGISIGEHTYVNGGSIPDLVNDELVLTFENPDQESMLMITDLNFIPWWFWLIYGVIVLVVNTAVMAVLYFIFRNVKNWRGEYLSISLMVLTLLLGMTVNHTLSYITYDYFFLNFALVFLVCNLVNCLSKNYVGTRIGCIILLFWYFANYYVILYRLKPIQPSDLYAIGTAGEVINGYRIVPTAGMIASVILFLYFYKLLVFEAKKENKEVSIKKRIIGIAVTAAAFVLCLNNPIYSSLNTFSWNVKLLDDFYSEGMVLSFTRSYFSSFVQKPEGYSRDKVSDYLEEYKTKKVQVSGEKPEKIIMIMNEAFSDLRDSGMNASVDVMPYIDKLDDESESGALYVSVLGGGTCNTEFEALTGNSMAFLPAGDYPYSQNIKDPLFSLASYFKGLGYGTSTFHPASADSWNRNKVYSLLSFDEFYSKDRYEGIEYLHKQPSDLSNYQFIEKIDKENAGAEFLFNVTIQNHSGYESWEDVEKNESAMLIPSNDGQIYLSLVAASDKAVEQLIEHYREDDEKVMIVFFGDHQPGLGAENDKYIYNNNVLGLSKFKTKFFIWTNYETEPVKDMQVSANYLPLLILERGGFDLPPYIKMLKDVYEKYPIITAQGIVDAEGNYYSGVSELKEEPLIRMYQYVQYANMFDKIDEEWFLSGE